MSFFWIAIITSSVIMVVLSIREAVLLSRMPPVHPDRGVFWSNTFLLLIGATCLLGTALYLNERRHAIEDLLPTYPNAQFAPDRSMLNNATIWIYTTPATIDDVLAYYRGYAGEHNRELLVDDSSPSILRLRMETSGPPIYLTVVDIGDRRDLNYSFEGRVEGGDEASIRE